MVICPRSLMIFERTLCSKKDNTRREKIVLYQTIPQYCQVAQTSRGGIYYQLLPEYSSRAESIPSFLASGGLSVACFTSFWFELPLFYQRGGYTIRYRLTSHLNRSLSVVGLVRALLDLFLVVVVPDQAEVEYYKIQSSAYHIIASQALLLASSTSSLSLIYI